MKRTIAVILALCLAALTASCSALDFKDHNKAIEKALMESGLNIASANAGNSNDGTTINFELGIVSKTDEFTAEDLRTVVDIVIKDTPRASRLTIRVRDSHGEWINLEPAYVALGFPTPMELYATDDGSTPVDDRGRPLDPAKFYYGRDYTEKILNK